MALTAQEQALLDSLIHKSSEPEPVSRFTSIESIVHELVRVSDKFSANPEERQQMLDYLESLNQPTETPAPSNGA